LTYYSHAFQAAQAASMERIVDVIGMPVMQGDFGADNSWNTTPKIAEKTK